jgi:hypothetical protein
MQTLGRFGGIDSESQTLRTDSILYPYLTKGKKEAK